MKTLFGTTALVMALAAPAFAQTAADPAMDPAVTGQAAPAERMADTSPYLPGIDRGVRASDFIGKRVYVTEQDTATMSVDAIAEANTDWEDAGEISDLIISMNGDSEAVLVDFGGFLGIGEKTVAISMSNIVMVPDSGSPDDYFLVFNGNRASLEGAPDFDEDMVFEANADMNAATDATMDGTTEGTDMSTTGAADGGLSDTGDGTLTEGGTSDTAQSQVPTEGMTDGQTGTAMQDGQMADFAAMTEADLIGKRVIGPNGEDVGEISAVTLGADNKITGAVVDVGGFLGMGEKPVALDASMLMMTPDADGDETEFRINMTQEELETLPNHAN